MKTVTFKATTLGQNYDNSFPVRPLPRIFFGGYNESLNGYGSLLPPSILMSNGDTATAQLINLSWNSSIIGVVHDNPCSIYYLGTYNPPSGVFAFNGDCIWRNINPRGRSGIGFVNDCMIHKPILKSVTLDYITNPAFQNDGRDSFENIGKIYTGRMDNPFTDKYGTNELDIKHFVGPNNYSNNALIRVHIPLEMQMDGNTMFAIDACSFDETRNSLLINFNF